jgi:hypothetical protein
MKLTTLIQIRAQRSLACLAVLGVALTAAACNDDEGILAVDTNRVYTQIERLGNPLVSEVFFMKRDHGLHNTNGPQDDGGRVDTGGKIKAFVASFGRSATIGNTLAAVLVPDMLLVYPNRAAATSGWLTWALANGYGGRNLTDDVVDAGLTAVFGTLLDPTAGTVAGLTSDNVPASVRSFSATFPYLEAPRP